MLLKFLRKRKNMKRIMWGLAIIIIPAFVIWGAGSAGKKDAEGPGYAGKIFGKKVSLEEYADMWKVARDYAVRAFGTNVPPELIDQLAWNRIILLEEAKVENIKTRDSEVVDEIVSFPAFQRDGRFDKNLYRTMLGEGARGFEERLRDDIRISKLREKVVSGVVVTDEELREEYKKKFEKIKAACISILFSNFEKDINYQESDISGFYDRDKAAFRKPETVNVKYIGILFSAFNNEVFISGDAVKKHFEEHVQDYKKPDSEEMPELNDELKKRISEKLAQDEKASLAEELAYKALDTALEKKSLEEAARAYGLEAEETGFFSIQEEIPAIGWSYDFTKTAFELAPAEISKILVKTDKGFYIVQLKERKKSYIPEFKEARDSVKDAYIKNKSVELAGKEAEKIYTIIRNRIKAGNNFDDTVRELKLEPKQTDLITRDSYIPGLGPAGKFVDACSSLAPEEVSRPVRMQESWVIARLDEYQGIDENKFLKDKDRFRDDLLTRKKQEAFDKWFEDLKRQAGFVSYTAR